MPERRDFDVLIVGAGPAGLAAAAAAAPSGQSIAVVDDNPALGGQIWRNDLKKGVAPQVRRFLPELERFRVARLTSARIIAQAGADELVAETPTAALRLRWRSLILATGARERFLPFPGWTLPGVMGAGGLQALAKGGWPVAGKRIIVAGSGPLLLAVAAYLKKDGANVLCVAEQAPTASVNRFIRSLWRRPGKLLQGAWLRAALVGVPYLTGCWPTEAFGDGKLQGVRLLDERGRRADLPCDGLACGFGLIPNTELGRLLGCATQSGCVAVSERQETSIPGVFAAGEVTGIGGLEKSLIEGQRAGLAAVGRLPEALKLQPAHRRAARFAALLEQTFALRKELHSLAQPDTFVCRCEDVPASALAAFADERAAKLQTRCGMGPCQGRICGNQAPRPPLFPARLESLCFTSEGASPCP